MTMDSRESVGVRGNDVLMRYLYSYNFNSKLSFQLDDAVNEAS